MKRPSSRLASALVAIVSAVCLLAASLTSAHAITGHTVTASFPGAPGGAIPFGGLSDGGDGRLYGTTALGGANNRGAIFSVDRAGGDYQLIHSFAAVEGTNPYSECIPGPGGRLYGNCSLGGDGSYGSVYSVKKDGTDLTVLHYFDNSSGSPRSKLVLVDNRLYGTCFKGVLYRINPDGNGYTVLHDFTYFEGALISSAPYLAADGRFYGTAAGGGTNEQGTIYRVDKDGSNFTVILNFDSSTLGRGPDQGVIQGTNGKLYGTTPFGGPGGAVYGTIYEVNTDGSQPRVLHTFTGGSTAYSALIQAADERLYGLDFDGGTSNYGFLYSLDTAGSDWVVEHNFKGNPTDGSRPLYGGLLLTGDKVVGLTSRGGAADSGTVFTFDAPLAVTSPAQTPGQFYLFTNVDPAPTPGEAAVTIRRTGTLGTVTVNYATAEGTALAGRDYTATNGVAAFGAGQTDQTIRIPLLAPASNGATLRVQLSNPTGGAELGNPSSLTVTIANSTPPAPSPYVALADAAYTQAAAYFAAGDQANGYFCYASYEYYIYLLDTTANAVHLAGYYQDTAYAYYISYTAAGDPAAALAWYNYYVSFI